jgi:fluoride exporter
MAVGLADNRDDRVANSPYLESQEVGVPSSTPPVGARVDPDVDSHTRVQRRQRPVDPAVVAVIAVGGVLGAEARYGLSLLWPHGVGQWPGATWSINVTGSFLLGALMVVLTELTSPHRLVRPFLGVGVLGGYTTFSTAMVDSQELILAGRPGIAVGYLLGTLGAALAAVFLGSVTVRGAAGGGRRLRRYRRRRKGRS